MSSVWDDQAAAAVTDARRAVQRVLPGTAHHPTPKSNGDGTSFVEQVLQRFADRPRCRHLGRVPLQPWHYTSLADAWTCQRCAAGAAAAQLPAKTGTLWEHTCDLCGRYSGTPAPVVIRLDLWVMQLALCRRCARAVRDSGGAEYQVARPPAVGGPQRRRGPGS